MLLHYWFLGVEKTVKNHVNHVNIGQMIEFEIKLIFPVSKGNKSPH